MIHPSPALPCFAAKARTLGLITDLSISAAFLVSPFSDTRPEEMLTSAKVLNGDDDAVFTADMPRKLHRTSRLRNMPWGAQMDVDFRTLVGRDFVKQKDAHGTEQTYAVAAMHQLRCVVRER